MKKWLVALLPLLLVITSLASLFYVDMRRDQFLSMSRQIPVPIDLEDLIPTQNYNRPLPLDPIHSKISLILLNGVPEAVFETINTEALAPNEMGLTVVPAVLDMQPMQDKNFNYQMLLSGLDPLRADTFLQIASRESDSLLGLIQDYEYRAYATESVQSLSFPVEEWKDSNFSLFHIEDVDGEFHFIEKENWEQILLDHIEQMDPERLIILTSLQPLRRAPFSWTPKNPYLLPVRIIGKDLILPSESLHLSPMDLSAIAAFTLGLSSPTGNMGLPAYQIFALEEEEAMDRMHYFGSNYLVNALHSLSNFGLDESIATGFFFHYSGKLDYAKTQTPAILSEAIAQMDASFNEFIQGEKKHSNIPSMIFAVALMALLSILWLLFLPYHYRGYLFGLLWVGIWLVFTRFVFRYPLDLPSLHDFSWHWTMTAHLWPLLLSTITMGILMTVISGFFLNQSLQHTIKDMQASAATFFIFAIGELAYLTVYDSAHLSRTLPGFFTQALFYRNLSYIGFLPLMLGLMMLTGLGVYGISVFVSRKKI